MPRKLLIAGIVITGVGLLLLGYLDPVIRVLFFGQSGISVTGGSTAFTRTGSFTGTLPGNFTVVPSQFAGRGGAAGTLSLVSVETIVVFVATIIGLLLTVAASFATKAARTGAGP